MHARPTLTESERYAEVDEMAAHSQRFAPIHSSIPDARQPVDIVPATLANCTVPRRNILAEYDALPVEGLIDEANELTARMLSATCNPRDYAIVVALVRRLKKAPVKLEGMLMLDFGGAR